MERILRNDALRIDPSTVEKHPTTNIQYRTSIGFQFEHSLDVGCSMLDVGCFRLMEELL
jgi:hypothetical protein